MPRKKFFNLAVFAKKEHINPAGNAEKKKINPPGNAKKKIFNTAAVYANNALSLLEEFWQTLKINAIP